VFYVGHFSFDGERPEQSLIPGETAGWFTLLVDADSPDEALDKFADLIGSLDGTFEGFDSATDIYVDSVTEVRDLPAEGVLAHWTEYPALDVRGSFSTTLPPKAPDGVAAFDWRGGEAGPEPVDGEAVEPFYTWEDEED
jgi:hypothetical protein